MSDSPNTPVDSVAPVAAVSPVDPAFIVVPVALVAPVARAIPVASAIPAVNIVPVALVAPVAPVARTVVMYTTTWCGDCHRAKRAFDRWGIAYVEVDIERTPGAAEMVMQWANGKRVVPTITIDDHVLVNPRTSVLAEFLGMP